jgi:hypothetical protein
VCSSDLDTTIVGNKKVKASDLIGAIAGLFDHGAIEKVVDVVHHNATVLNDYNIDQVMVAPNLLGKKGKPNTRELTDVEDLPDGFDIENLATQDVMHDFKPDEQTANSRKDKVPGYKRGESGEKLFGALLEQHLRSIKLASPNAFGALDDDLLTAMVSQLLGDTLVDVATVVDSIKGLLTKANTALVSKDLVAKQNQKDKKQRVDQKNANGKFTCASKTDDDFLG